MEEIAAHKRTDAALQKAKESAEAANFAKSRYIVGLSHEFRTPLNSIFGYAQLLEREPELARENPVRVIRRSAEHLSNLVDGLLDISRVETGTLHLNQTKFCLPDLLDQMADMFRIQASARGIEFRYRCDPGIPQYVVADDKRLRQILINLLSNAIKYTKQGHAALEVRRRNHLTEFVISDSGIGILPEDMEMIFHPFERGGMAHARAIPGTGLGLTITRLLTKAMGGELTVASTPGEGSCFTVRMLLFAAMPEPRDESLGRNICGYIGERLSILIADDNPSHLDLVHRTLSPLGFAVRIAQDGAEAVAKAAESLPDIALLDISMPGLTGWEVAAQLRLMRPRMKIMMVSGNAHDFQAVDREGSIHDAFLIKPFTIQSLLESVQLLCKREWIYEAPARQADETAQKAPAQAMPSGTRYHVEQLIHLGQIGYVHGIYAKLAELDAENAAYKPMTNQARLYVRQFQFDDYLRFLKAYHA
jgi:CheY-like chemotaxis protein/anti-sigma regulatory factor (Ser/Thr protein kinase)